MPKVFISYGRDESHGQNLATETQVQLQAAGYEVFRDVIGLKPGDVWYSKLEFELETSDLVVLVVSERVRKSKWVHNEISMAEEIGLPVIPVFAENVRSPLWLRHLQALNFSEKKNWPQLISAIRGHTGATTIKQSVDNHVPETKLTSPVSEAKNPDNTLREQLLNPHWANSSGKDQYGQYADLQINNVTQRFRLINPGTFLMGSPLSEIQRLGNETRHEVALSKPFWLADTTVTQALWLEVLGTNPAYYMQNINNPVEQVSWDDSQEFIQSLNWQINGLSARLPTEAQWEYACRAGTNTPFSFGSQITPKQVNYDGDTPYAKGKKGLSRGETIAVKSLSANTWGLYEMHGNVWEWCQDTWLENLGSEAVADPEIKEGAERVLRGGSWYSDGRNVRSAYRYSSSPDNRSDVIGFRLSLGQPEL